MFGVFGGSFNPIHQGHVEVVRGVLERDAVDHVLVVPASRSPFKEEPDLLPATVRWRMVRAALGGMSRVSVLDAELRRPAPSYTLDTLVVLAALFPAARLKLVLGLDTFQGFCGWQGAGAILARTGLLLIGRRGLPAPASAEPEDWRALLPPDWRDAVRPDGHGRLVTEAGRVVAELLSLATPPISSTQIREQGLLHHIPSPAREVLASCCREAQRAGEPLPPWVGHTAAEETGG